MKWLFRELNKESHWKNWSLILMLSFFGLFENIYGRVATGDYNYNQGYSAGQKAEQRVTISKFYLVNKSTCPNVNYCIVEVKK